VTSPQSVTSCARKMTFIASLHTTSASGYPTTDSFHTPRFLTVPNARDDFVVFNKDKKSVTAEASIKRKHLFSRLSARSPR
jgi:hypothetical protein